MEEGWGANMVSVDDGSVPGANEAEKMATWKYWQEFNLDKYYESIKHLTFDSTFIPLSLSQSHALSLYLQGSNKLTSEDNQIIKNLKDEMNFAIKKYNLKAFAKLSTRSPKDAVDKLPQKLIEILRKELEKYPKTNQGEFVAFRQALMEGMAVSSADQLLELFSFSSRIISDLKRVFLYFSFSITFLFYIYFKNLFINKNWKLINEIIKLIIEKIKINYGWEGTRFSRKRRTIAISNKRISINKIRRRTPRFCL